MTNLLKSRKFEKNILLFGYLSIFLINIIILLNPTKGYELSIYESTPLIIWVLFIFSCICGISIMIYEVYKKQYDTSYLWIFGLILLLICRLNILYLPYNRGYFSWMGDHISHIGYVREIIISGFFDINNFYPITHIFLSEGTILSNLPLNIIINYSTAIISIIYVLTIYLIAKFIFNDRNIAILALAAVACVLFSGYDVYLMPNGWSALLLPFSLYLIIRAIDTDSKKSFQFLALIFIILLPFFHTLTALIIGCILLILTVVYLFMNKLKLKDEKKKKNLLYPDFVTCLILSSILYIIWSLWTISFTTFNRNIKDIIRAMIFNVDITPLEEIGEKFGRLNLNLYDIFFLLIKQEGPKFIFLLLFILGAYIAIRLYHERYELKRIFVFIGMIMFIGLLYASYLFNIIPGLSSINASRILIYPILLTPIFAGVVLMVILANKKVISIIICILIIIIPVILSIFSIFPSPYIHRPTPQVTIMDMQGMEWSIHYKDRDYDFVSIMVSPFRFATAILGVNERNERFDIHNNIENVPDHFNYQIERYFGNNYSSKKYLVLTKMGRIIYNTVYQSVGRFTDDDFIHLKNDPSVHLLYNNGECNVYYIDRFY